VQIKKTKRCFVKLVQRISKPEEKIAACDEVPLASSFSQPPVYQVTRQNLSESTTTQSAILVHDDLERSTEEGTGFILGFPGNPLHGM